MRTAALLLVSSLASPALASTIVVNATADDATINSNCTLREAIIAANTDAARDGCRAGSGADLIVLPAGTYTLSIAGQDEGASATGDLDVISDVHLVAPAGAAAAIIDAAQLDRAFDVGVGARLRLQGVSVRNGTTSSSGARGGAVICNGGALEVIDSEFQSNSVAGGAGAGGAIYGDGCQLEVLGSTFSGNSAVQGGAICSERGSVLIRSSTFTGNTASAGVGHAIQSVNGTTAFSTYALLEHVTVSGNGAGGSAIRNSTGLGGSPRMELRNSIIEAPASAATISNNAGVVTSLGGNIFSEASAITLGSTDLLGAASLGAFGYYGGSTRTMAPPVTSAAIDRLSLGSCSGADQRGIPRPQGNGCEPGAVEFYGYPILFNVTPLAAGSGGCANGGVRLEMGRDDGRGGGTAGNGVLEAGEVVEAHSVCSGTNGTDGADGSACTIVRDAGGATISCTDGTTAVITDGADGADGSACTVTQGQTGATVTCTDGTSANANHGSTCSVAQTAGGALVACTDGSSAQLTNGPSGPDGADATPCHVEDHGDGTATVTCPDGSTAKLGVEPAPDRGGCTTAGGGLSPVAGLLLLWLIPRRRSALV